MPLGSNVITAKIKQFSLHQKVILSNIHLEIVEGDRIGVIGPNGAGKTVLLRVLARIYQLFPSEGSIIHHQKPFFIGNLQTGTNSMLSVYQNINLILLYNGSDLSQIDSFEFQKNIKLLQLNEYLDVPFNRLSQGYKLRVQLLVFFLLKKQHLILDEFFGFGDKFIRDYIASLIADKMSNIKSLVLATHNQKIIDQFCNKIIAIDKGSIKI